MDPHGESGNIIYDCGVDLLDTWRAMENLAEKDKCRAIGLSHLQFGAVGPIYEAPRIKPVVVQAESQPCLAQAELWDFCK